MSPAANAAVFDPATITEGILTLMERSDADDVPAETPDLGELLTDPRRADEINAALSYLEALGTMTAQEIARQQARQRAIEETAYQIQRAVLQAMEQQDAPVVHGQFCTLRRRLNPPAVRIEDPAAIPAEFLRQPPPPPPVADKTAIKRALEADQYVPGAVLTRGARLERK